MKKIELNFSVKKDKKVMQWLELLKESEIDSSPYVVLALEYYISTGKFVSLGSVDNTMEPSEKIRKTFYIPNNSAVESWAEDLLQRKKGLLSTQIRYILEHCIENGEKGIIKPYAELIMLAEKDLYNAPTLQVQNSPPTPQKSIENVALKRTSYIEVNEIEDEEAEDMESRQQAADAISRALLPKPEAW